MKTTYTAADFMKPKVVGLAIHNAELARNKANVEAEERNSFYPIPPEALPYCLFIVRTDASVLPIAGESTAADFAPLIKSSNLALLAAKYSAIGFVTVRQPASEDKWGALDVPRR